MAGRSKAKKRARKPVKKVAGRAAKTQRGRSKTVKKPVRAKAGQGGRQRKTSVKKAAIAMDNFAYGMGFLIT